MHLTYSFALFAVLSSIGGDDDLSTVATLPSEILVLISHFACVCMLINTLLLCFSFGADVIKKYNPDLKGFSVKIGGAKSENARLNVAVSGAKAK